MNTDKELIDYVVDVFPIKPGCVGLSQFHSQMINIVLPAYAKLRQDEVQLLQEEQEFDLTVQSIAPLTWDGISWTGDPLVPLVYQLPDGVVIGSISNTRSDGG
jgi:hypothetical protein